jgi:hypothetical protein
MTDSQNTQQQQVTERRAWVEPTVRQLDVRETAFNPSTGGDGQINPIFADCSRS